MARKWRIQYGVGEIDVWKLKIVFTGFNYFWLIVSDKRSHLFEISEEDIVLGKRKRPEIEGKCLSSSELFFYYGILQRNENPEENYEEANESLIRPA